MGGECVDKLVSATQNHRKPQLKSKTSQLPVKAVEDMYGNYK